MAKDRSDRGSKAIAAEVRGALAGDTPRIIAAIMLTSMRLVLGFVLTILAVASWSATEAAHGTASETSASLRPICLGRYLLDVPADVALRGALELVYGLDKDFKTVKVEVLQDGDGPLAFDAAVAQQISALASHYDADTPTKNMFARQRKISGDAVLILGHREPTMMGYYVVLLVKRIGSAIALFTAEVFKRDKPEDIEASVLSIADRTRYRDDVGGKGTCIGPLLIDAGQDGERFYVGGRGKAQPDLVFSVNTNSLLSESDGGLITRVNSKAGLLAKLVGPTSSVRRGKVTIAARPGEEIVDEERGEGGSVRLFVAETSLTKGSTLSEPQVHLEMNLGGRVKVGDKKPIDVDPSLDRDRSLKMWDAIINSIRLRLGSV